MTREVITPAQRAAFIGSIGTRVAPITDPNTARPSSAGAIYWVCAAGVTPVNAAPADLIWNAGA